MNTEHTSSPAPKGVNTAYRWSGKKTAVAAALALGLSSAGAVGAAAAVPQSNASTREGFAPGGGQHGGFGSRGGGPAGQVGPGAGGIPGTGAGGIPGH